MVTLAMNGATVRMVIGLPVITVGLDPQTMDTSPQIIPPGRTMLPARFVAQAFGYTVTWNPWNQTVVISVSQVQGSPVNVLIQPTIAGLTETVGSTTATETLIGGGTRTIQLPAAPVLVLPNDSAKQWVLNRIG